MKLSIASSGAMAMLSLVTQYTVADSFTIAATGDYLGNIVPSDGPLVTSAWNIVRGSDFGYFNLEGNIFDLEGFEGYPGSENGKENGYGNVGGGAQYPASQAAALAEVGFNLASHANNHGFDWLEAGMFATHHNLASSNITVSGGGKSLQSARAAAFHTIGNVTVGLVSAAGSHQPAAVAGAGSGAINPRPGLSVLRSQVVTLVTSDVFEAIKKVAAAQGQTVGATDTEITLYVGQFPYQWSTWRLSPNGQPGLAWDTNESDRQGILSSIRAAREQTTNVIFSFHGHDSISGNHDSQQPLPVDSTAPASYIQNISRSAVEAGAMAVFAHGPHHLRGIEMYQGKPIFYSLGSMTYSLGLKIQGIELPIE
jgi:hypothetical protein